MRKRLLVFAPEFVPHPSPSGHRARYMAQYGPANGWDVEVLSVKPERYATPPDDELYRLLPPDLEISRTEALPLRLTRRVGVTDTGLIAYWHLRRALVDIIATRRPTLIYTYGPVFYTFRLATFARRRFGVPYVLDYTDPWVPALTGDQRRLLSKANISRQLGMWLEPETVRHAAHIFAVSDGTNREIQERNPDVPPSRFSAMPFGFEASDYRILRDNPRPNRHWDVNDGNAHFVYAGAMLPHGFETLEALLDAALWMREHRPRLFERLRFHFFGTTYDPHATEGRVLPIARAKGLESIVTEHPRRIPYIDALNVMTSANAVMALGSTEVHYTASKIFPCLLSTRPVLALYHEASNVCDTVRAVGTGELVTYNDAQRAGDRVPQIADAITRIVEHPEAYPAPDLSGIRQFSAESLMGRMYRVMDTLVDAPERVAEPVYA